MNTAISMPSGSASPPLLAQANGRRSSSLEMHRRRNSGNGGVGDYSPGKTDRARSPLGAVHSGSAYPAEGSGIGQGVDARRANTPPVGTVVPPPKERLPPSPPLTPVASLSSLRKTALGTEANATPKSARSKEASARVATDKTSTMADGSRIGDEMDVVTDADGELSTWSFRPDGDKETSLHESENVEDGAFTLAQPAGVTAISHLTSPRLQQEPTPPQDNLDPLHGTVVDAPTSYPNIFPPINSASSMPNNHEASSSAPPHLHPLHNPPSPQPWDLVDPPPNNNAHAEERMRRGRKESNRSMPGTAKIVVTKDGKKYRIPHSSYYFGPPPDTSAFGTDPIGQIGVHHPREVVRIERDYSGGELVQFSPAYPLELEGRITPTQFLETVNAINESLIGAHSLRWSFLDNTLAVLTLYISRLLLRSHYEREMNRLRKLIEGLNKQLYNPAGLNILWPKDVAFMFLEIEYY